MEVIKLIKGVEYLEAKEYDQIGFVGENGVRLFPVLYWSKVEIRSEKSKATLTISSSTEKKSKIWTASLSFLCCEFPAPKNIYIYKVELVDGTKMLIGNKQHPYPITEVTEVIPENATENQLLQVSVQWKSSNKVPYLIEE